MKLSRRDFLSLLAAAGSTACIGGSDAKARSQALLGTWPEGEETWTPTICRECSAGCGLLGRVVDGRVVGLVGNPLHPINRGAICGRGVGALQTVYDSQRFKGPMIRRSGKLVPSTWDEALAHVGEHLRVVRGRGRPERLSIVIGDLPRIRSELWERFARSYGTPNLVRIREHSRDRASVVERLIYDVDQPMTSDWERSDLVLSFGFPLLDGDPSPIRQHRQRTELARRRGRLIQVESRLSATAARADDWLAVIPGSEAALALSLARIVLESGQYDSRVEGRPGFESWTDRAGKKQPGIREWLLGRYEPLWCEKMTGIEADRVETLGAELIEARSPIVLFETDRYRHPGDLYSQIAFATLNVMIGALGRTGGLSLPSSPPVDPITETTPSDEFDLDAIAKAGLSTRRIDSVDRDSAFAERDEPIEWARSFASRIETTADVVLIDAADPVGELLNGSRLAKDFGRVPLVVVLATAPTSTTEHADVVLPSSHFLESWSEEVTLDEPRRSVYSIAQPVLEPLADSRPAEEILVMLGEAVGAPVSAALPSSSLRNTIRRRALGIHRTGRGRIGLDLADRQLGRRLRERVETSSIPRSGRRFFKSLLEVGVWIDSAPNTSLDFPRSLAGPVLDRELSRVGALHDQLRMTLREPEAIYLPHYEGPLPESGAEAVALESSLPMILFETVGLGRKGSRAPWLQESLSPGSPASWSTWIELNPQTASLFDIRNMQRIRVSTSAGELEALARLTETARPGYVYLPLGVCADSQTGRATDARVLIQPTNAPFTGLGLVDGIRVRIRPA